MKTKIFIFLISLLITNKAHTASSSLFSEIMPDKTASLRLKTGELLLLSCSGKLQPHSPEVEMAKRLFTEDVLDISEDMLCIKSEIIIHENKLLVGVLFYEEIESEPREISLEYIAIVPEHQKKGIGKALIYYLAAFTECSKISLISEESALSFYKDHLNFVQPYKNAPLHLEKSFNPPLSLIASS